MINRLGYLSEESISDLNKYFENVKSNITIEDSKDELVKSVRILPLSTVDDPDVMSVLLECYHMIDKNTLKPYTSYIIEYYEDSYTQIHTDKIGKEEEDSLTTITLLDKSEDLNGGKIILGDVIDNVVGSITIFEQDIGEMISYNHRTYHGVSKVLKGTRRVLVNWYKLKG
jgi:hypothetical protein